MREFLILKIRLDDLSDQELKQKISDWLLGEKTKIIVTPNPEFFLLARQDKVFLNFLNQADLSLPDGVGLEYAIAALTNNRLEYRHTGVDTVDCLAKTGERLALVGGQPEVTRKAAEVLKNKYPNTDIIIVNPGDVPDNGSPTPATIKELYQGAPKILAVALGQGKQEKFIAKIIPHLPSVRIAIGIGGALDMIAGFRPRAPLLMRQVGLEWLWRLFIEPRRWQRILRAVFVFPAVVVWSTLMEHRFWRACKRVIMIWLRVKDK